MLPQSDCSTSLNYTKRLFKVCHVDYDDGDAEQFVPRGLVFVQCE